MDSFFSVPPPSHQPVPAKKAKKNWLAGFTYLLAAIAVFSVLSTMVVSSRLRSIQEAAESAHDVNREINLITKLSPKERAAAINQGSLALEGFERQIRLGDAKLAGQLGSIWSAVRRQAMMGSVSDADINWMSDKSHVVVRSLEQEQGGLRAALFAFQYTCIVAILALMPFLVLVRRIDLSSASAPATEQNDEPDQWLLEAAERRYEKLFESLPVGCCGFGIDGRIVAWNRFAEEITGKYASDVIRTPLWDAIEWRHMPEVSKATLQKIAAGESPEPVEWVYQHPNGDRRTFSCQIIPSQDSENRVTGGIAVLYDVTAHRQRDDRLRESDETKAAILSALPDCLMRLDAYGRLVDLSHVPTFASDDLASRVNTARWREAFPEGLGEVILRDMRKCTETSEDQRSEFHLSEEDEIHLSVQTVKCGPHHCLTILHDIFDRYRAETAIKESETRLRHMIQGSGDVLSVIQPDGTVTYQSASIVNVCDLSSEAVLGHSIYRFIHPKDRSRITRLINDLLKKPFGEQRFTCRFLSGTGDYLHVEFHARNLLSNPYVNGVVLHFRDVTTRRQLERELKERVAQTQLLNNELKAHKAELEAMNATLESLATTDSLTSIANHREMFSYLSEETMKSADNDTPLSIVLLDMDSFKSFNDKFGHVQGDQVLIQVGKILREVAGENGLAARYGGEEFALILPGVGQEEALSIAEKARQSIESFPWPVRAMTASFGVATMKGVRLTPSIFLNEADEAMYASKKKGKNTVTHARQLRTAA